MSKKNLTQEKEKKNETALYFVVALIIVMIYIFYPYDEKQKIVDSTKQPEIYLVVSNGCGIPDIAQEISQWFLERGIDAMTWKNTSNPNCIHQKTMIVVRQKSDDQKIKLNWLEKETGIDKVIFAYKEDSLTEFELVLGKDYINYFK